MWGVVKAPACSVNVKDWRILKRHWKEQWGGASDILDVSHERTLTNRNMFTQQHYASKTHNKFLLFSNSWNKVKEGREEVIYEKETKLSDRIRLRDIEELVRNKGRKKNNRIIRAMVTYLMADFFSLHLWRKILFQCIDSVLFSYFSLDFILFY